MFFKQEKTGMHDFERKKTLVLKEKYYKKFHYFIKIFFTGYTLKKFTK